MDYIPIDAPRGWICPKCGRVYSPSTPCCLTCRGNSEPTIANTGTVILNDKEWWKSYLKQTSADSWPNIGDSDYWNSELQFWSNTLNKKEDEGE